MSEFPVIHPGPEIFSGENKDPGSVVRKIPVFWEWNTL